MGHRHAVVILVVFGLLAPLAVVACGGETSDPSDGADASNAAAPDSAPDTDGSMQIIDAASDGSVDAMTDASSPPPSDGGGGGPDADASDANDANDANDASDAIAEVGGPTATLRVGYFASEYGAFDFCWGEVGGPLAGPWAYRVGWGAMTFGWVSPYLPVPSGKRYMIRPRRAPAQDCAPDPQSLYPDFTTDVLNDGAAVTIAATGDVNGGDPHVLTELHDDVAAMVPAGASLVRVVNLAPAIHDANVAIGGGAAAVPFLSHLVLAQPVTSGNVATGDPVDANGYVATRVWNAPMTASVSGVEIATSRAATASLMTFYLIGRPGNSLGGPAILTCYDTPPPGSSTPYCVDLGIGQSAPPAMTSAQIVNLAPDAPSIDACFKPHAASAYPGAPVLATANAPGVGYAAQSGGHATVPTGDGVYDVKLIAAGTGSTCAQPAIAEGTLNTAYNSTIFIAAVETTFGASPVFAPVDVGVSLQTFGSTASVTIVNAEPGAPTVRGTAQPMGMAGTLDFNDTAPGQGSQIDSLSPDTYTFGLLEVGPWTTLYTSSPLVATAGAMNVLWYVRTSASTSTLQRCLEGMGDAGYATPTAATCGPL